MSETAALEDLLPSAINAKRVARRRSVHQVHSQPVLPPVRSALVGGDRPASQLAVSGRSNRVADGRAGAEPSTVRRTAPLRCVQPVRPNRYIGAWRTPRTIYGACYSGTRALVSRPNGPVWLVSKIALRRP